MHKNSLVQTLMLVLALQISQLTSMKATSVTMFLSVLQSPAVVELKAKPLDA